MSTWQVLSSDAGLGDNYQWELSLLESEVGGGVQQNPSSSHDGDSDALPSSMSSVVREGCSKLLDVGEQIGGVLPVFRTGSGKSVPLKRSSFVKALSILGDHGDDGTLPVSVPCAGLQDCPPSSSSFLFQTGSGKTVRASSAGLERAKRLLGLEGDAEAEALHVVTRTENIIDVSAVSDVSLPPMIMPCASVWNVRDTMSHVPTLSTSLTCKAGLHETLDVSCYATMPEMQPSNLPSTYSSIKFQTAGGRSISMSGNALKRARSLLGDPEMGGLLEKEKLTGSPASFSYPRKSCDVLSCKENVPPNISVCLEHPRRSNKLKSFLSPLRPTSNKLEQSNPSESLGCSSNLNQILMETQGSSPQEAPHKRQATMASFAQVWHEVKAEKLGGNHTSVPHSNNLEVQSS